MREKKDRVDDALHATKAAIEEGIVPGGGAALLQARDSFEHDGSIGAQIVYDVCASPFKKILSNAGYEPEKMYSIINEILDGEYWDGYNLKTDGVVNMKEAGIIDPLKVTRAALENAASVAGTILLTEAVVVDKPEETKSADPGFGNMGGMF